MTFESSRICYTFYEGHQDESKSMKSRSVSRDRKRERLASSLCVSMATTTAMLQITSCEFDGT
jgi:hypothetical protein